MGYARFNVSPVWFDKAYSCPFLDSLSWRPQSINQSINDDDRRRLHLSLYVRIVLKTLVLVSNNLSIKLRSISGTGKVGSVITNDWETASFEPLIVRIVPEMWLSTQWCMGYRGPLLIVKHPLKHVHDRSGRIASNKIMHINSMSGRSDIFETAWISHLCGDPVLSVN